MQKNNWLRVVAVSLVMSAVVAAPALAQGSAPPPKKVTQQSAPEAHKGQKSAPSQPQKAASGKKQPDWMKKGGKMPKGAMGPGVDYRKHNLKKPPQGSQWVKQDGNYILVQITTGVISSIIAATR